MIWRIWVLIRKGIRLGPQNPILIFALIVPILYTVIFQLIFGDLLKQKPVIVVYEKGERRISDNLRRNRAVDLVEVRSKTAVMNAVKQNRADIGLVLPSDIVNHLESAGLASFRLLAAPADPVAARELLKALKNKRTAIGVVVPPGASAHAAQGRVTARVFLEEGGPDIRVLLGSLEETGTDVAAVIDPDQLRRLARARPKEISLKIYVSGESLAKDRTIAVASVVDALRSVAPQTGSIDFGQISLGKEKAVPLLERMLPFIVLVAVLVGAFLLPATFLVQEKEKKTLTALLVTPLSFAEVLVAFGALGTVLAVLMGLAVLVLNVGLSSPLLLLLPLVLGSILMAEWGLTAGLLVKDMNSLFANIKLFGILFYAPAIVLLFPSWPQWIARIFPTFYIVNPVYRVSIFGEGWSEIGWQIYVLVGFIFLFFLPLTILARNASKRIVS
jgi:ABC-2 type transport system permease protein